jgi:toxin YoeB
MDVLFHDDAFEDYRYFKQRDVRSFERINKLIKDIVRSPFSGIGKPEPLKYGLSGAWSRRINQEHRLVYQVKDGAIYILQCKYNY